MSLPAPLTYNSERPLGFPSDQQVTRFYPQNGLSSIANNDTIRISARIPNGYWDPYSTYLNIEVDTSQMEDNGLLQLDGSAHSFIAGLTIWSGGVELERINEYDILGNILVDMQMGSEARFAHSYSGVGYSNESFRKAWIPPNQFRQNRMVLGYNPTVLVGPALNLTGGGRVSTSANAVTNLYRDSGNANNPTTGVQSSLGIPFVSLQQTVLARHKFKPFIDYDSAQPIPGFDDNETAIRMCWSNCASNVVNNQTQDDFDSVLDYNTNGLVVADNSLLGVDSPYSYSFSNTCFEETFSKTIANKSMINGMPKFTLQTKSSFSIPLLSGIFGALMPKASYRFVPIGAIGEVIFEFRMNPYAMFTSGYTDLWYVDQSRRQIARNFRISRLELVTEIVKFAPEVSNILNNQLESGIVLHTNSWWNCLNYNISNNLVPPQTAINVGFQSLKSLYWGFYSLDYLKYSFCRKLYRLCHQITGYQIKVGTSFIPSQSIKGNSGSVIPSSTSTNSMYGGYDNSEFVIQLHKSFGKFMDIKSSPFISQTNFAINDRFYDPSAGENTYPRIVTLNGTTYTVPFGPFFCNYRFNIGTPLNIAQLYRSNLRISNEFDIDNGTVYGPYLSNLDLGFWVNSMTSLSTLGVTNVPSAPPGVSTFICLFGPFFSSADISIETSTLQGIGLVGTYTNVFVYANDKFMDYNCFGSRGYRRNQNPLQSINRIERVSGLNECPPTITFAVTNTPGNPTGALVGNRTVAMTYNQDVAAYSQSSNNLTADLFGPFVTIDEALNIIHGTAVNNTHISGFGSTTFTKLFRTAQPANVTPNLTTACGYPLFHENRCVGKALFGIDLETMDADHSVLSGLNTISTRPFDLLQEYDSSSGNYKRDSVMVVFGLYDMIVRISNSGVEVMGRS